MAIHRRQTVVLAAFLLLCAPALWAFEVGGRISVTGAEAPKALNIARERLHGCGPQVSQELLTDGKGHLRNAVVYLEGNLPADFPPGAPPVVDQAGCLFEPHVLLVPLGREFRIANSDPMGHDVRAFGGTEMLFRFEMDAGQKPVAQKFERPGQYVLRCGLHKWMYAFVFSIPHPFYAVSDAKGGFLIKNVPAGKYVLHVWHETLGESTQDLEVEGDIRDFSHVFSSQTIKA